MKIKVLLLLASLLLLPWAMRAQVSVLSEGFEGGSIPAGWTIMDADGDNHNWVIATNLISTGMISIYSHTGTNFVLSESYDDNIGTALTPDNWLVTPAVTIGSTGMLSFWVSACSNSYAYEHWGVYISTTSATDTAAFTLLYQETIQPDPVSTSSHTTWTEHTFNLSAYAGQTVYVAFRHFNSTDQLYIHLDDVYVGPAPTCNPVANLLVSNITSNSADIFWSDSAQTPLSYQVEVNGVVEETSSSPYHLDNLNSLSSYTVRVRPVCNAGDTASWCAPVSFTTLMDSSIHISTVANGTITNEYVPVYGWYADEYLRSQTIYPASMLADLNGATLHGMRFYLDGGTPLTSNFEVKLMEVQPSQFSSSSFLNTASATTVYTGTLTIANNEMLLIFSTPFIYNGGNLLMDFYSTTVGNYGSTTFYGITAFNASLQGNGFSTSSITPSLNSFIPKTSFLFSGGATCLAPTNAAISALTTTSADFTWEPNGTGSSFEVYIAPSGTVGDLDNVMWINVGSDTSYSFTGLLPFTNYSAYVRSDCGSEYSAPSTVNFMTLADCGNMPIPYRENFNNYINGIGSTLTPSTYPNVDTPACWTFLNRSTSTSTYPMAYLSNSDNYAVSGNCLFFKSSSSTPLYAILPLLSEPLHNLQMSFHYRNEGTSGSNGTLHVGYMTSLTDANTFVPLYTCPQTTAITEVSLVFDTVTVTPGATYYIAFKYVGGSSNNYYLSIDDVVVEEIPSCMKPTGLTLASTGSDFVTLSWTETGTASVWNVAYGPSGFNPDTVVVNVQTVNTTPSVTIPNLLSAVSYDFYVQADCGSGISDWRGPLSATTGSYYMSVTGWDTLTTCAAIIYDDGGPTGDYSLNCNSYLVIYPDQAGSFLHITGSANMEDSYDYLRIYDGSDTSSTYVEFTGSHSNVDFLSTNGPVVIWLSSDGMISMSGFEFLVSCENCSSPAISLSAVGIDEASFTWNIHSITDFEFVCVPAGVSPDSVQPIFLSNESTYTVNGLTPGTLYNAYLRADCGGGEFGMWQTVSFTTSNGTAAAVPYYCGFEDATENAAWMLVNGTQTNRWYMGGAVHNTGDSSLYISGYNGSNNNYDNSSTSAVWAYRDIAFGTAPAFMLSFDWRAIGEDYYDYLRVFIGNQTDVAAGSNTIPAGAVQLGLFNEESTWQTFNMLLSGQQYANTTKRLYFLWENDYMSGTNPAAAIDNISIEPMDCFYPQVSVTDPSLVGITVNVVPASPADVVWEIVVDDSLFYTMNDTSYVISDLLPGTTYTLAVRTLCNSGDTSIWSAPVTFTTACMAETIPYTQGFEGLPTGSSSYLNCWNRHSSYSSTYSYPYLTTSTPNTGTTSLYFYSTSGTYNMAIAPELDLSTYAMNQLQVSFAMRNTSSTSLVGMIVGVMTIPEDTSTFVPVDTVYNSLLNVFQYFDVSLASYTGNGAYVAMKSYNAYGNTAIYVDDFSVTLLPMCARPVNLQMTGSTTTSVTLSWTEVGTATAWEIEYGVAGFAHGTGTSVQATSNPFTVPNLSSGSNYQFYVRAVCDNTNQSEWSNPIMAHADCDIMTVPYVETFDNYSYGISTGVSYPAVYPDGDLPSCWDFLNRSTSNSTYPMVFLSSSSTYAAAGKCLFFKSSMHTPLFAILPEFQENINTLKLHFMYRNESSGSNNGTLYVGYMTDRTDTSTFTTLFVCPQNTTLTPIDIDFDTVSTVAGAHYHIAFQYKGGLSNNYYLSLDSVRVELNGAATLCEAPIGVTISNIAQTSATITWTPGDDETDWNLQYKTGTDSWSNAIAVTGAPSYNLTGLTSGTSYQVRVQAVCTPDNVSDWSAEATFTTLDQQSDTCMAPTNVAATDITDNSAVISWTQSGNTATSWEVQYRVSGATDWSAITSSSSPHTLTGLSPETNYEVQVITHCTNSLTSEPSTTISFTTEPVGINDYTLDNSVTVYPNPTPGVVQIKNEELIINNLEVYDAYGKILMEMSVNGHTANLDLGGYAKGTYFVRVTMERGVVTKRVVKN